MSNGSSSSIGSGLSGITASLRSPLMIASANPVLNRSSSSSRSTVSSSGISIYPAGLSPSSFSSSLAGSSSSTASSTGSSAGFSSSSGSESESSSPPSSSSNPSLSRSTHFFFLFPTRLVGRATLESSRIST